MKRSLSLILSLTMLLAVLYPCQSIIAAQTNKNSAVPGTRPGPALWGFG